MKLPTLSYRAYVRHVRRQGTHIQRVHAFIFAATITGMVAVCFLYYDYGFWHDVYIKTDQTVLTPSEVQEVDVITPIQSLVQFFGEVKDRFGSLGDGGKELLQGTDIIYNNASTNSILDK